MGDLQFSHQKLYQPRTTSVCILLCLAIIFISLSIKTYLNESSSYKAAIEEHLTQKSILIKQHAALILEEQIQLATIIKDKMASEIMPLDTFQAEQLSDLISQPELAQIPAFFSILSLNNDENDHFTSDNIQNAIQTRLTNNPLGEPVISTQFPNSPDSIIAINLLLPKLIEHLETSWLTTHEAIHLSINQNAISTHQVSSKLYISDTQKIITNIGEIEIQISQLALLSNHQSTLITEVMIILLLCAFLYSLEINYIKKRSINTFYKEINQEKKRRKGAEQKLIFNIQYDQTTHLLNRIGLCQHIEKNINTSFDIVLIGLSINNLIEIDELHGNEISKKFLQKIIVKLQSLTPSHCTLSRTTPDQFICCFLGMSAFDTQIQANRIYNAFSEDYVIEGYDIQPQITLGIVHQQNSHSSAHELLRFMDTALHHGKKTHKNIMCFSETIQQNLDNKKSQEIRIKKAILNDELQLMYQPQVDIRTQQITGIECLLRWGNLEETLFTPTLIVETAERIGLMQKLGQWIIKTALEDYAKMFDERCAPKHIAINISGREFQDPKLAEYILRAVKQKDIPPSRVHIELTEQVFIGNITRNQKILNRLAQAGIKLVIDDFGTGYSSLAYLKNFPISTVKIDQSFIKDLPESKDDLVICQAVISMANLLELDVVAEGIETIEHQEILRNIGCYIAQGYYYYRPIPVEKIIEIMKNQRQMRTSSIA
ncbi:MAG: GGDEF domain-containing protein [Flavobacteriales bacterium]|nr:GGDEF domain-containing protein [Flavobacteriales bacterium]